MENPCSDVRLSFKNIPKTSNPDMSLVCFGVFLNDLDLFVFVFVGHDLDFLEWFVYFCICLA